MKTLKLKLLELFSWKSVSFLDPQHAQMLDHFLSHSSPDGDCFHLLLWVGGALYCVFFKSRLFVFTFHFWQIFHSWWCETVRVIQKNVTF